ncbi:restriction endonuclease subunit S [Moraxella catarrhalis]|uniref:Type I restriction-modification system, specificity subunit S n=1 Tax=Moraxella catarrhalis TaxID=480 RepID=A0A198UJN3_MORCA|nr:restriction endonuclease subunit S [Moraxella catarrhalis]OAU96514.1 Type I restriction-modification system, specificity subunit S [Moraxella catarrhalis]OAU96683.1 Type I restriction-modification system, specificity subunit S [Moraxella catarrhalis]OAV03762.1 Type I restriction-modification system, specificity subunit S [Moraxella catarrhalis]
MTAYKQTELGLIPSDWEVVELGNLFEINAGGDLNKNIFSLIKTHEHIYPVYSNAITNNGLYGFLKSYDYDGEYLTVTARGYIGYSVARNGKFSTIGRLLTLKPKNNISCYLASEYINEFVNFAIESTGVPQLTAPQIAKYSIIIPKSITEQTAIATALSDTDALITELEKLLAKKQAIKTATMQQLLTGKTRLPEFAHRADGIPKGSLKTEWGDIPEDWEVVALGEYVNIFDNQRIPVSASNRIFGNIPYYGANGIQDYVNGFTHDGEFVLVAEDGANDLINYPVQYTTGKIWVNNHAHVLQGKKNILCNKFLAYCISSMNISHYLVGGTRAKLNGSTLKQIEILCPQYKEQTAIAQILGDMDSEITALQARIEKLREIKQGMMQNLLTGKIRLPC